jgi:hypothetical protein
VWATWSVACRYQRLLAQEFDRKLKEARRLGKRRFLINETVDGQAIAMPDYAGGGTYPQASGSSVYAPSLKGEASSSSGAFNLQNFIRAQAEGGTPSGAIPAAEQNEVNVCLCCLLRVTAARVTQSAEIVRSDCQTFFAAWNSERNVTRTSPSIGRTSSARRPRVERRPVCLTCYYCCETHVVHAICGC